MPPAPLPSEVIELIRRPNPAVIASLRPDGSPHTIATWYDWQDGHVLLNMDESRRRLGFIRADPRVALTVLDSESWYRHISLIGLIVRIKEDAQLNDIDRLAIHYTGQPFQIRHARRYSAWMKIDAWHGWEGSQPWPRR